MFYFIFKKILNTFHVKIESALIILADAYPMVTIIFFPKVDNVVARRPVLVLVKVERVAAKTCFFICIYYRCHGD